MAKPSISKKTTSTEQSKQAPTAAPASVAASVAIAPLFSKQSLILMLAGVILMAIGMMAMAGGKSSDPNVFKSDEVYSFTRITIAPILIVLGLAIEVVALFWQQKNKAV